MKILLASVESIINIEKNEFYDKVLEVIDKFISISNDNKCIIISSNSEKLNHIPIKYNPLTVSKTIRNNDLLIKYIIENEAENYKFSDFIVLGAKDNDFYLATNSKILLLSANYAKNSKIATQQQKIFQYGIPIKSIHYLDKFLDYFARLTKPWYYGLKIDDKTVLISLLNANDFGNNPSKDMSKLFRNHLKEGIQDNKSELLSYFTLCVNLIEFFRDVDFWGIYPSSNANENPNLRLFCDEVRKLYKKKSNKPIFLRIKPTRKRSKLDPKSHKNYGCFLELNSIILNPDFTNYLNDKTICIIDDFTTYGTSCETARHLLGKVGVKKLIFITIGKFGAEYYKYHFNINGDVFSKFTYELQKKDTEKLSGNFYQESHKAISVLRELISTI